MGCNREWANRVGTDPVQGLRDELSGMGSIELCGYGGQDGNGMLCWGCGELGGCLSGPLEEDGKHKMTVADEHK
jgi:hypothetical protein